MHAASSQRTDRRIIAAGLFVLAHGLLLASLGMPALARAEPTDEKIETARARAAEARERLDSLAADLEERSEEYLAVEDQLVRTRADLKRAELDLGAAETAETEAEEAFDARVQAMYRRGRVDLLSVILGIEDFRDLVTMLDLLQRVGRSDAAVVARVEEARRGADRIREVLENRRTEQVVLLKEAAIKRREVRDAYARQKQYLAGIDKRLSRLIAQERERQERIARERAAAAAANAAGRGGRPFDPAALGEAHPSALDVARRFVDVTPYVWGGTTPAGFDCSGLTMYSYRQIGINIPRTSREQYRFGAFIPPDRLDLLMPGDLVFFGREGDPNRVHHVGIYAGGDDFVHAPQTGMKVGVSSLRARIQERGDYVGATRP